MSDIGYDGMSYHDILNHRDKMHSNPKSHKQKAVNKYKDIKMTGRSQKEQMRFTKQNMNYQNKIGRAWND